MSRSAPEELTTTQAAANLAESVGETVRDTVLGRESAPAEVEMVDMTGRAKEEVKVTVAGQEESLGIARGTVADRRRAFEGTAAGSASATPDSPGISAANLGDDLFADSPDDLFSPENIAAREAEDKARTERAGLGGGGLFGDENEVPDPLLRSEDAVVSNSTALEEAVSPPTPTASAPARDESREELEDEYEDDFEEDEELEAEAVSHPTTAASAPARDESREELEDEYDEYEDDFEELEEEIEKEKVDPSIPGQNPLTSLAGAPDITAPRFTKEEREAAAKMRDEMQTIMASDGLPAEEVPEEIEGEDPAIVLDSRQSSKVFKPSLETILEVDDEKEVSEDVAAPVVGSAKTKVGAAAAVVASQEAAEMVERGDGLSAAAAALTGGLSSPAQAVSSVGISSPAHSAPTPSAPTQSGQAPSGAAVSSPTQSGPAQSGAAIGDSEAAVSVPAASGPAQSTTSTSGPAVSSSVGGKDGIDGKDGQGKEERFGWKKLAIQMTKIAAAAAVAIFGGPIGPFIAIGALWLTRNLGVDDPNKSKEAELKGREEELKRMESNLGAGREYVQDVPVTERKRDSAPEVFSSDKSSPAVSSPDKSVPAPSSSSMDRSGAAVSGASPSGPVVSSAAPSAPDISDIDPEVSSPDSVPESSSPSPLAAEAEDGQKEVDYLQSHEERFPGTVTPEQMQDAKERAEAANAAAAAEIAGEGKSPEDLAREEARVLGEAGITEVHDAGSSPARSDTIATADDHDRGKGGRES